MELLHVIAPGWATAALTLPTCLTVLGMLAAPLLRRVPRLAPLGSYRMPIYTALWVFAVAALSTVVLVRDVVGQSFQSGAHGMIRAASVDAANVAATLSELASVQATAAMCLLVLVPAAVLGAWRRASGTSVLARAAPVAAAVAIAAPVAVGAIAVLLALDAMTVHACPLSLHRGAAGNHCSPLGVVERGWDAIEVGRWAVVGTGAIGLMAVTPIVVAAAERGHVIGRRAYAATQVVLLVGFGAWALTRLCAEDVRRGPLRLVEERPVAERIDPAPTGVSPSNLGTIDLPRGAWCHVDEIDPVREVAVPLALTHSLEGRYGEDRFLGVDAWATRAERTLQRGADRTPVLVAAIDRSVRGSGFGPYLEAARDLGIERLAILTFTDDRRRTLTLGEVYTRHACVLVRTDVEHAYRNTIPGVWWGSLSRHLTEASIR